MAKPVIFDDGGSIRIRQLTDTNNANMDGLIGTPFTASPPELFGANPCYLAIRSNDIDGTAGLALLPAAGALLANHALQPNDVIVITSTNGHTATITISAAAPFFQIVLTGGGGGNPQVDGRQTGRRRRYVVSNAGFIQTVTYTLSGVAANIVTLYDDPNKSDVYTMVHFGTQVPVAEVRKIKLQKYKK